MSNKIHIKPTKPGAKVHLENKARDFLPADGAEVDHSIYWMRRINDGSVKLMTKEEVTALQAKVKAAAEAAKKAAAEAEKLAAAATDKKE